MPKTLSSTVGPQHYEVPITVSETILLFCTSPEDIEPLELCKFSYAPVQIIDSLLLFIVSMIV